MAQIIGAVPGFRGNTRVTSASRPHHVNEKPKAPQQFLIAHKVRRPHQATTANFTVTDVQRPVISVDAYGSWIDIRKNGRDDQPNP